MNENVTSHLSIPSGIKKMLVDLEAKFDIKKFDGKGASAYTFFGKNRVLGTDVAIKFYYWGGDPKFHAEPKSLMQIKSPNVLPVLDAGYVDGEYAYFVTPYCPGGDLDDLMTSGPLGTIHAVELIAQILDGVGFLHAARFVHRDIKPLNIFLGHPKLAIIGDFGSLKQIPHGCDMIPGSGHARIYCPPESVCSGLYGFGSDLYQVGIVMYQLLGGYLPYDEVSWLLAPEQKKYGEITDDVDRSVYANKCIDKRIMAGRILRMESLPYWIDPSLKSIIRAACQICQETRLSSCAEFRARLHLARSSLLDWSLIDGILTLNHSRPIRLIETQGKVLVERKSKSGWRKDGSLSGQTKKTIIANIKRTVLS